MVTEKQNSILKQIPANRRLVEELYSHGKITQKARQYALSLLYPHDQWGMWISRLLLAIGTSLVLSGIVYFFAFNWAKILPAVKLAIIEILIISCLLGAYACSLQRLGGKVLLLSASVMVGVFMAVFGQMYQTGADAYQLFMTWSLLTLGWTLLSNFVAQWFFWLVITNIFLVLWWRQGALPSEDMAFMIFIYMTILNGIALAAREYFSISKASVWLESQWTRMVLIVPILATMLIPIVTWIFLSSTATISIKLGGIVGLIGHGLAYFFYRYKLPDMRTLAAIVFSGCIAVVAAGSKIITETLPEESPVEFLLIGLMTIIVFSCAIAYLRNTAQKMKTDHV